jgi:hypothetical protein
MINLIKYTVLSTLFCAYITLDDKAYFYELRRTEIFSLWYKIAYLF